MMTFVEYATNIDQTISGFIGDTHLVSHNIVIKLANTTLNPTFLNVKIKHTKS